MTALTLLLAAAAAGLVLARAFRAPPIPFLVLAGVALSTLSRTPEDILDSALILGVSFLIFALGLELDPGRIRVQRRAALRVGAAQFAVLAMVGWGGAHLLGFDSGEAAFVALALPASSTLVAVRILQRRRQMYEPFGRLVLGVLLTQDLLVVLLVPVVLNLGSGPEIALSGIGAVILLGLLAWVTRTLVAPMVLRVSEERELVLLGSLAVLFLFLGAASLLRLPGVVGAFLAGVALARFPVNGIVRSELAPLRDFFAAVFFVALGALVRVPTGTELVQAGVLAAAVVLVTPPLVAFVAERSGFSSRSALEAGLLLSQTSEISLVVGLVGLLQGSIGESLFVVLSLVSLGTMVLTPVISTDQATRLILRVARFRQRPDLGPSMTGHVLVLGAGSSGMPLVEDLLLTGTPVAVVDEDPAVVAELRAAGIHAVRGEVSDLDTLAAAGLPEARAVCSTARRVRDNANLLRVSRGIPILIRVFEEEDARWVRERGGEPLLYASAAAGEFLEWFVEEHGTGVASRVREP